jgi:glyoxylase-like metal-dependent hydrolase (beta-lactamase superfamily II)
MKSIRGSDGANVASNLSRSPIASLPCVHRITLPTPWEVGSVDTYLVEGDPLTLIDCGVASEDARSTLSAALEHLGYGFEDIRRIILTHYHRDHMGNAEALRRAADDLEVWAHEDAVSMVEHFTVERDERLEDTAALFLEYGVPRDAVARITAWREERMLRRPALCEPTQVDRVLRGGDVIEFKELGLEVIHAPGHTAGHILLHHEESGVLFTGDQILGGAVPNTENYYLDGLADPRDALHRRPRFMGLLKYRESLRALRRQSFSHLLPAYGGVIMRPDRAIQDALLFYEVRIQRIERSLKSVGALGEAVTAYELWRALFPNDDPVREIRNHILLVIGALDVLEATGRCMTSRRDDGVLVHSYARR